VPRAGLLTPLLAALALLLPALISTADARTVLANANLVGQGPLEVRPVDIGLGAGELWVSLTWSDWGSPAVSGTGQFNFDNPSSSSVASAAGVVTLSRLRSCGPVSIYTRMTVAFSGSPPPFAIGPFNVRCQILLGTAGVFQPDGRGFGEARPGEVDFGGDGGRLWRLRWSHWGRSTATATANGFALVGTAFSAVPARVVASSLGLCMGLLEYRQLSVSSMVHGRWTSAHGFRICGV